MYSHAVTEATTARATIIDKNFIWVTPGQLPPWATGAHRVGCFTLAFDRAGEITDRLAALMDRSLATSVKALRSVEGVRGRIRRIAVDLADDHIVSGPAGAVD